MLNSIHFILHLAAFILALYPSVVQSIRREFWNSPARRAFTLPLSRERVPKVYTARDALVRRTFQR